MEIYRNEPQTITLRKPVEGTYEVKVISPEHESTALVAVQEDVLEFTLDFQHTWFDGELEFQVTVTTPEGITHTYSEYAEVVTPLFRASDLDGSYPADKTPELERLVRKVIEARTGQTFGKVSKTVAVEGDGSLITFDAPLIELYDVSTTGRYMNHTTTLTPPKESYEIASDGFSISIDWDRYHIKSDSLWILTKRDYGTKFLTGAFGYDRVPQDVKEAALLIAGVWGCDQALWRDRYIQTMRSSDWSVQYNNGAYASTGSVTADQLLAKYTRRFVPEVF